VKTRNRQSGWKAAFLEQRFDKDSDEACDKGETDFFPFGGTAGTHVACRQEPAWVLGGSGFFGFGGSREGGENIMNVRELARTNVNEQKIAKGTKDGSIADSQEKCSLKTIPNGYFVAILRCTRVFGFAPRTLGKKN
jgi:hypothetical protein